jgi:hypothetical protein
MHRLRTPSVFYQNGEEAYYDATGTCSQGFQDLMDSYDFGQNKNTGLWATLYDYLGGSGALTGLTAGPRFTFGGANDRAESASGVGGFALFERTWWRGSSRYIFLIPGILKPFNGSMNFMNTAASSL